MPIMKCFYYAKLLDATQKSKLKEMFVYIPKLEKVIAKLNEKSDNPNTKKLVDEGNELIRGAKEWAQI